MDIGNAAALWVLGDLPRERLPSVAVRALEVGLDSPALRRLAGLAPFEMDLAWGLFADALKELGMAPPDKLTAIRSACLEAARMIMTGAITPRVGAGQIGVFWEEDEIRNSKDDADLIDWFYALADEWDELPRARAKIEAEILSKARELVGTWSVGSP